MLRIRAFAQQPNYRGVFAQTRQDCNFGVLLLGRASWHDENPSDQLKLEQIASISIKIRDVASKVCFNGTFNSAVGRLREMIVANAKKQNACDTNSTEALTNYKIGAALYFSNKELDALQGIKNIEDYLEVRGERSAFVGEGTKEYSEKKEQIPDLKEDAKDAKKIAHITMLLLENHKSAAAADLVEFIGDKSGDKLKDATKKIGEIISAEYLEGQYLDWMYRHELSAMSESSIMECR